MASQWLTWSEVPWLQRSARHAGFIKFCERLATLELTEATGLTQHLGDICAELGAPRAALVERTAAGWNVVAAKGESWEDLPMSTLADVCDRDAACCQKSDGSGVQLIIPISAQQSRVLLLEGPRLSADHLPEALAVGRVLNLLSRQVQSHQQYSRRITHLREILDIARSVAGEREIQPLLERIAEAATKLLHCDRASIFLWDREQRQLVACPALGVKGGRLWLADNKGIVGEVIHSRKTLRIDDAYKDTRFDQSVDKASGYRTRNLLCVPLLAASGECLGAFELINKSRGDFTGEDETTLEEFCVQVAISVTTTREMEQLTRSNQQLHERVQRGATIIGPSPSTTALRGTIERLAATDLPVLILGESGTGKEVAAQALHHLGPRKERPFIAVNCAALTETLLESELFGHEKGAFTDAQATHVGKFELAAGGTLFLDEIGDMTLGGQAKLLRVLEQKVITRVGGTQSIPVNVRVLAATNASLTEMVREKKFRQDLYYRLSVVTVEIPPLRDRPEDVLPLAEFFLARFCTQAKRKSLTISPDARRRLQAHGWPGNVRELRNLMERIAFLSAGPHVEVDDLAFILSPQSSRQNELSDDTGLAEATNRFQREFIKRAVKRVQGNMSDAADLLGLHRSNLYRKMRQLGMEVEEVKP